jgi:hypothetical protein
MCSQLPQQAGDGYYQHGAKSDDEFREKEHDRSIFGDEVRYGKESRARSVKERERRVSKGRGHLSS